MFSEKVDNSEKLGELKDKNEVLVVYFGESEGDLEWKTYKLLAQSIDDFEFVHIFDEELRK